MQAAHEEATGNIDPQIASPFGKIQGATNLFPMTQSLAQFFSGKKSLIATIGLFLGSCSITFAADILFIGDPGASSTISLLEFLDAEGHAVTQEIRTDGPGNANEFDLVIIGTSANRNDLSGTSRTAKWNAVTAPVLCLGSYLYPSMSGWGWITSSNLGNTGNIVFDTPYPEPNHPFLSDLVDPTEVIVTAPQLSVIRPATVYTLPSGATTVATGFNGISLGLFTIDAGTILSDSAGTPAGNIRIGWPMSGPNYWGAINENGEQIMRNIIAEVVPKPFRIIDTSLESRTGDFLVTFSPGGTNYTLKSSQDLTGPFEEVSFAELENDNTTFRIPAADLNPGRDFFVIEVTPSQNRERIPR